MRRNKALSPLFSTNFKTELRKHSLLNITPFQPLREHEVGSNLITIGYKTIETLKNRQFRATETKDV